MQSIKTNSVEIVCCILLTTLKNICTNMLMNVLVNFIQRNCNLTSQKLPSVVSLAIYIHYSVSLFIHCIRHRISHYDTMLHSVAWLQQRNAHKPTHALFAIWQKHADWCFRRQLSHTVHRMFTLPPSLLASWNISQGTQIKLWNVSSQTLKH